MAFTHGYRKSVGGFTCAIQSVPHQRQRGTHMKRSSIVALGVATAAISVSLAAFAPAAPALQVDPDRPVRTAAESAAQESEDRVALLAPLRKIAEAVTEAGTAEAADTFSGVRINAEKNAVEIYLTDISRADSLLLTARRSGSEIDAARVEVKQARYTKAKLRQAREEFKEVNTTLSIDSFMLTVPADGHGLDVYVENASDAQQRLSNSAALNGRTAAALVGVEVFVKERGKLAFKSRQMDDIPWIGGAAISFNHTPGSIDWACSTGIPAQRKSDGRSFIITAAHCGAKGNSVYTGREGGTQRWMGQAEGYVPRWDAMAVNTGSYTGRARGQGWDRGVNNPAIFSITAARYSYDGDYVCQNGFTTAKNRGYAVCNIKVIDQDTDWQIGGGTWIRGVAGEQTTGIKAAERGDSGGLVFANAGGNNREARGIVSAGDGGKYLAWPEAPDILNQWGMRIATDQ